MKGMIRIAVAVLCVLSLQSLRGAVDIDPRPESRVITYGDGRGYANAFDIGVVEFSAYCTDTRDTRNMFNLYGDKQRDVFYSFTLARPMYVAVTHAGSELCFTQAVFVRISRNEEFELEEQVVATTGTYDREIALGFFGDWFRDEPENGDNPTCVFARLDAGKYYIISAGQSSNSGLNDGIIRTNFYAYALPGESYERCIDLGTYNSDFMIGDGFRMEDLPLMANSITRYYKLTFEKSMSVHISGFFQKMDIQDIMHKRLCSPAPGQKCDLPAGTYFLIVDYDVVPEGGGVQLSGEPYNTQGDTFDNPIDAGAFSDSFHYESLKDTSFFSDDYGIYPTNDIFFRFTLARPMYVNMRMSNLNGGTYMALLNDREEEVLSSDKGVIISRKLVPGTYFLVTKGKSSNGSFFVYIDGKYDEETSLDLSKNMNYIRTTLPLVAVAAPDDGVAGRTSVDYYDFLGRYVQQVQVKASPHNTDLVSAVEYDKFGQETKRWLTVPYLQRGAYVTPDEYGFEAVSFYGDSKAFTEQRHDVSPLFRPVESYNPGSEWRLAGRSVKTVCRVNGPGECKRFAVDKSNAVWRLDEQGTYLPGALSVTEITDEDNKTTVSFADSEGRVLLRRRYDGTQALDTYYVYDFLGNLCWVLPPMAASARSEDILHYAYQYRYGKFGRRVVKQVPGSGEVRCVYNSLDMVVAMQDAKMASTHKWLLSIPDRMGRISVSAICGDIIPENLDRLDVWVKPSNSATGSFGYEWDVPQGVLPAPLPALAELEILQVNYYDSYEFLDADGSAAELRYTADPDYGKRFGTDSDKVCHKGLLTGALKTIIGTSRMVATANYYDYRMRPVQIRTLTPEGTLHVVKSKYDFAGQVLSRQETLHPTSASSADVLESCFAYDRAGRLLSDTTILNNGIPAFTRYSYDEVGRQVTVTQGSGIDTIRTTDTHNIRGWITSRRNDMFSMSLAYNAPRHAETQPSYAGNISEWTWRQGASGSENSYVFSYDGLSRLVDTRQYVDGRPNERFVEKDLSYDNNGNILSLTRLEDGDPSDAFQYVYSGNRLAALSDGVKEYNYDYDLNGNITHDGLNNLDNVYNSLNLLEKVDRAGVAVAKYSYLSDGTKLSALSADDTGLMYFGSFVYNRQGEDLSLESVGFTGGRFVATAGGVEPHYYLTDHLGSVRVVMNSAGEVVERNDYYPFGLRWNDTGQQLSDNRYRYNGKEDQLFVSVPYSDYGARMYDPVSARWTAVDPLAEKFYSTGTYVFCTGDPVRFVDPDGKQVVTTPILGMNSPLLSVNDPLLLSTKPTMVRMVRVNQSLNKGVRIAGRKINMERIVSGRKIETEQLQRMGLSKNNKPIAQIDPKTGQKGTTVPDGLKNGRTVEIKNVKNQNLTKQLRLQEKISQGNGDRPILRINKEAQLSEPLKNSSFEIQTYSIFIPLINDDVRESHN